MSLTNAFSAALAACAPFQSATIPLVAEHAGVKISAAISSLDRLACAFENLLWETACLANVDSAKLAALGEDVSRRVHYLLEPIGPVELDADACVLQMRSVKPSGDQGANQYYEILIRRGGSASLSRYSAKPGQPRELAEASVTREVLLRLVGDFDATLRKA